MRIVSNGKEIDPRDYGAESLGYSLEPAKTDNIYFLPGAKSLPIHIKQSEGFDTLSINLFFSPRPNLEDIARFAMAVKTCTIELDDQWGQDKVCECILKEHLVMGKSEALYLVSYQFDCAVFGLQKTVKLTGQQKLIVDGVKESDAVITISNLTANKITAKGIGVNAYRVDAMEAGETIVIDGIKKLVSSNKRDGIFGTMRFNKFPLLVPGTNLVEVTCPQGIEIKIKYRGRW